MDRKEFRRTRDEFWKALAQCDGSLERLYAETANRFAAKSLTAGPREEPELNRLETLLTIVEGELAAAYMREHGWELDRSWKKKEEVEDDL